jgi:hypothetical protein
MDSGDGFDSARPVICREDDHVNGRHPHGCAFGPRRIGESVDGSERKTPLGSSSQGGSLRSDDHGSVSVVVVVLLTSLLASATAVRTTYRVVLKAFFFVESLFTFGEDEFGSTVFAVNCSVWHNFAS